MKVNRTKVPAGILIVLAVLLCFISGCSVTEGAKNYTSIPSYSSFRDIPGVTTAEINEIERLKEKRDYLVIANTHGTESFYDVNGNINGFIILLCEWLTGIFGIRFEPEIYDWGDLIAGLDDHTLDFTGDMTFTEERIQSGYIMTGTIAERVVKIMRVMNSTPLFEIAALRPVRYAFLSGAVMIDSVSRLSREKFSFLEVDDNDEAYRLLKSGEIDAYIEEGVSEAAFDKYGDITAYEYLPLIFNPVSLTTKNPELAPVISVVQKALEDGALRHLTEVYNAGETVYYKNKLLAQLSEEEIDFIHTSTTIPFAAEYDNYPVSFYNSRERQWQGIAFDIIGEIAKITGLSFEVANEIGTDWTDLFGMLENGEAYMVTELIRSPEREGRFLWPDKTHVVDYYALLSRTEFPDLKINEVKFNKTGVVKDTGQSEIFQSWFPSHTDTVMFVAWDDSYEALSRGDIDLLMAGVNQLLSLTNFRELSGFKANIIFNQPLESAFGFNIKQEILRNIVEKSLHIVDVEGISDQWTRKTYDYTIKIAQARLPWLIGVSALLMIVLILVFIILLRHRREGKWLESIVRERTFELELASRAKSNFLANMSH